MQVGTGGPVRPVSGLACWPLCMLQMPLQLVVSSGRTPGHRGCLVTSRDRRAVGVPGDRAVQRSGLGVPSQDHLRPRCCEGGVCGEDSRKKACLWGREPHGGSTAVFHVSASPMACAVPCGW